MKVHANAPLGPKGRETMVLRVLEQGWSLTEAAEAAGVSERTCSKWVRRYRADGKAGLLDRSSAPRSIPHRTPDELVEIDRAAAQAADDRGRDRVLPGDGALDGLGGVAAGRAGQAVAARAARAAEPLRAPPRRRAAARRRQKARAHPRRPGRAPCHGNRRLQLSPRRRDAAGATASSSAGNSSTSASTTPPAWPTSKSSPTRRPPPRSASCNAPSRSTPATASPSGA